MQNSRTSLIIAMAGDFVCFFSSIMLIVYKDMCTYGASPELATIDSESGRPEQSMDVGENSCELPATRYRGGTEKGRRGTEVAESKSLEGKPELKKKHTDSSATGKSISVEAERYR
jgi:hypothetical protein